VSGPPDARPPERVLADLADVLTACAVRTAAALRLADHVAAGHRRLPDLAAAAGVRLRPLEPLVRLLADRGVFRVDGEEVALTPVGDLLRSDHPRSWRAHLDLDGAPGLMQRAWTALPALLRTGEPGFPHVAGGGFWSVVGGDPGLAASFDRYLDGWAEEWVPAIVAALDVEGAARVVDIGGGSGRLLAALLARHRELHGTLVELPATAEAARQRFAGAGLTGRVDVRGGDFDVPPGADLYVLAQVLHDWPDEQATGLLRTVATAAGPAGQVVVVERLADGGGHAAMDLLMLNLFGSAERTRDEYERLAAAAGLHLRAVDATGVGLHLLTFTPSPPTGRGVDRP
jgi:SAM-dependent methyltransferase